jgi:hypothetical protein
VDLLAFSVNARPADHLTRILDFNATQVRLFCTFRHSRVRFKSH